MSLAKESRIAYYIRGAVGGGYRFLTDIRRYVARSVSSFSACVDDGLRSACATSPDGVPVVRAKCVRGAFAHLYV